MANLSKETEEILTKEEQLLMRFYDGMERLIDSDLPDDDKITAAETLYVAYCTAANKKINYELLKH